MKGNAVEIEWRTVQLFLNKEGRVDEVSLDTGNSDKMRCTCPQFGRSARCKHVKFMRSKINASDGVVSIFIPNDMSEEEATTALDDVDAFRDLVLKYGKIEFME